MSGRSKGWLRSDAGRFAVASAIGAALALVVFTAVVTRGTFDLFEWQRSGNFYDAQAQSWLDGTWEVSGGVLGIERWVSRGNTYMYQGPWPAVLRVPAMAVTDRLEGRMTQASMLLGALVALVAVAHLHWRVRRLVRGEEPVARRDLVAAGAATFAIGAGSALLYEASRAWVYHEAAVWGAAWSIAAIDGAVGCALKPSRARLLWAGTCTALALCSRSSVGLAGVAALGLLAGGNFVARVLARTDRRGLLTRTVGRVQVLGTAPRADGTLPVAGPALAGIVPLGVYAMINWIKFRTLFSIPFWGQGFTMADPERRAFLRANHGTLFGLKFSPTTFVQYLRPDGVRFTRTFPFLDFPPRASGIGGVTFDLIDHTSSLPASMPAIFLLAIVGVVVLLRRRGVPAGAGVAALRAPALGAAAGALTIIPFGYIANRYLADALPALALLGLIGLQAVLARTTPPSTGRPRRALLFGGLAVLVVAGLWVNTAQALVFQRLHSPNVKDDVIAGFLDTQYDAGQSLGLDPRIPLRDGEELPLDAPRGEIVIIGDCEAMYLSDGMPLNGVKRTPWNAVMRTEAGGRFLRTATFPVQPPGTRVPLWTMTSGEATGALTAQWQGGAGVVFDYDGPGHSYASPTLFISPDEVFTMELVVDPRVDTLQLWLDGEMIFEDFYGGADDGVIHPGVDALDDPDITDAFPGRFEPLPERTAPCAELRREAAR